MVLNEADKEMLLYARSDCRDQTSVHPKSNMLGILADYKPL